MAISPLANFTDKVTQLHLCSCPESSVVGATENPTAEITGDLERRVTHASLHFGLSTRFLCRCMCVISPVEINS